MNDSTEEALERYGTHGDMGATVIQPEMAVAVQEKREMDLPSLFKLAEALVPTGFLPEAIRTPGQAVAIILAGRELGIGPMLALRSIGIIKGKVVLAADLQLAQFKKFGGKADFKELSEQKATLWLRHPNGDEHTETFTIEDAKRAGLVRAGGNWTTFPKAMLRSRAITAGLKSLGFEPTCGAYDPDEALHFQADEAPKSLPERSAGAKSSQSSSVKEVKTPPRPPSERNSPNPVEATPEQREADHAYMLTLLRKRCGKLEPEVVRFLQNNANKKGITLLLPTEALEDLKLDDLRALVNNWDEVYPKIEQWMQAEAAKNDQIPGAEAQDDPGMDGDGEEFELSKPDEPWRQLVAPFGKNKGEKLGDLEKKDLWYWVMVYKPEPFEKGGKTYPPRESDVIFYNTLKQYRAEIAKRYGFREPKQ